jgi:hypothetical protein
MAIKRKYSSLDFHNELEIFANHMIPIFIFIIKINGEFIQF